MIELKNITKAFPDKKVLNGINATFEQGKINLIIGQSGSGKTVLLKSIIGLHEIDEGEILYNGRNFNGIDIKQKRIIRKEIGMVFQGSALFDSATIEENVMFPLNMFTTLKFKEKRERVNYCLKRVGLEKVNALFPSEISGGMQKRVAIARAIAMNPKYLFCDEPNSGLDPKTALVIDELIKQITLEYGITTVINTHDMNSVMEIGDKILFILGGDKCWEGTKEELMVSNNEELNSFVFASKLFQSIKYVHNNIDSSLNVI